MNSVTPRADRTGQVPPRRVELLIGWSDERDQWVRLLLDWARSAYRSGYQAGHDAGYRTGYEQAVTQWKITAAGVTHLGGRTYAEQDRRRYPPGGRLSWLQHRLGDLYEQWAAYDADEGQQP